MLSDIIQILLKKQKMNVPELAKALGTSSQNIYNKLGRDNFSERELIDIANAMNCEVEVRFLNEKGHCIEGGVLNDKQSI